MLVGRLSLNCHLISSRAIVVGHFHGQGRIQIHIPSNAKMPRQRARPRVFGVSSRITVSEKLSVLESIVDHIVRGLICGADELLPPDALVALFYNWPHHGAPSYLLGR